MPRKTERRTAPPRKAHKNGHVHDALAMLAKIPSGHTHEMDLDGEGSCEMSGLFPAVQDTRLPQQRPARDELHQALAHLAGGDFPKSLTLHAAFCHLNMLPAKIADSICYIITRCDPELFEVPHEPGKIFLPYKLISRMIGRKTVHLPDIKEAFRCLKTDSFYMDDKRADEFTRFKDISFIGNYSSQEHPERGLGVLVTVPDEIRDAVFIPRQSPIVGLGSMAALDNKYAYRIFPWFMALIGDHACFETRAYPVENIRKLFLLLDRESSYWSVSWGRFNGDIFKPAIRYINNGTPLKVTPRFHKNSASDRRIITDVSFELRIDQDKVDSNVEAQVKELYDKFGFTLEEARELVASESLELVEIVAYIATNAINDKLGRGEKIYQPKRYFEGILAKTRGRKPSALVIDHENGERIEAQRRQEQAQKQAKERQAEERRKAKLARREQRAVEVYQELDEAQRQELVADFIDMLKRNKESSIVRRKLKEKSPLDSPMMRSRFVVFMEENDYF